MRVAPCGGAGWRWWPWKAQSPALSFYPILTLREVSPSPLESGKHHSTVPPTLTLYVYAYIAKGDKNTLRRLFPTNVSTDGIYILGTKN